MEGKHVKLLILDCNSIIHRAFHALPPLTTSDGKAVQAVYGFCLVFLRAVRELTPTHIAAAFDFPAPTFREKTFREYKAKRPPAPKELYEQIPKAKEILAAFSVPVFEKEGFEADDVIGTIAKIAARQQVLPKPDIVIASGDADVLQLVDANTKVWLLRKGVKDIVLYDEARAQEKYEGLTPSQLVDFRALRGDPSDNIPGVSGIGEKTAKDLLLRFSTLDNLYEMLEKNDESTYDIRHKVRDLLRQGKDQALLSRQLAEIRRDAPLEFRLDDCRWGRYSKETARVALKKFEFETLAERVP